MTTRFHEEANVTVDATAKTLATLTHAVSPRAARTTLQNLSKTTDIYLSTLSTLTADETATGGFVLEPRDTLPLDWGQTDIAKLYFRVAAGTAVMKVLTESIE